MTYYSCIIWPPVYLRWLIAKACCPLIPASKWPWESSISIWHPVWAHNGRLSVILTNGTSSQAGLLGTSTHLAPTMASLGPTRVIGIFRVTIMLLLESFELIEDESYPLHGEDPPLELVNSGVAVPRFATKTTILTPSFNPPRHAAKKK